MPELIITKNIDAPGLDTLKGYRKRGGYKSLAKALKEYQPDDILEMVKKSGLRGRGGAGFPTGMKWGFLAKNQPRYLCCNCDESEPGTFKDRMLMEKNPHQLIEGCLIACYAAGLSQCFLYSRGEMALAQERVAAALNEAYAVLRQPFRRADYLLGLLGGPSAADMKEMEPAFLEEMLDRLDVGQGKRPVAVTEGWDLERRVLPVGGADDVDDGFCKLGWEQVRPLERLDHGQKL